MLTGCDYYLFHIFNVSNVEDVSHPTEMDTATNMSGLYLRVKSGDHPKHIMSDLQASVAFERLAELLTS